MLIDIRTQPADNDQFATNVITDWDADNPIAFTYYDYFSDDPTPTVMTGLLFPAGLDVVGATCEQGHAIPARAPVIVIVDYSTIIMCPDHFRADPASKPS